MLAPERLRPAFTSKALFLVGVFAVVAVVSGCGSSTPERDPATVARLVAEGNALCESVAHRANPSRAAREQEAVPGVQRTINALMKFAAYLPAGRDLIEAHAQRRAVTAEMLKMENHYLAVQPDVLERFHRLQLRIYDDVKALGLTSCLEKPPRAPIGG